MITFSKLGDFGRLGNQMFQIASTIGHAVKCRQQFGFPDWKYQDYFKNKLPKIELPTTYGFKERLFHYHSIPCTEKIDLEGYFQSWKYFENCKELIRHYFEPNDYIKEWVLEQKKCAMTGIHVRRGDYLGLSDYHINLTSAYYVEAKKRFPLYPFIVFSDDPEWCKKNIYADYYASGNEIEDLFLFAACESKIIANSSFSWWAAYLGGGDVIAPRHWFGEKLKDTHNTKDLYLPNWTLI